MTPETAAAYSLLNAQAVRDRAHRMLALGLDDKLPNFRVDLGRLDDAVERVLSVTQKNYPSLDVPFHSRWRHFVEHGDDRHKFLIEHFSHFSDPMARARSDFDLAIVSVLLDAGAGPQWRYRDPIIGHEFGAIGRLGPGQHQHVCLWCVFLSNAGPMTIFHLSCAPMQMFLANLETKWLRNGFQVTDQNPLSGLRRPRRASSLARATRSAAS